MRNSIKCFVLIGFVALIACKNDKRVAENTASASVGAAAPATSTNSQAISGPITAEAAAATKSVQPNTNQVTPSVNNGKTTTVKFDEMSYDWGKLKEGDKMTHLFKFKNTGDNDLIISDAHGSCGCTVPEWPKEPIKPGKGGEIKVVFDSAHKSGPQSKTVTINANTEPASIVLMIKGIVDAKEEEAKTNN